MRKILTPFLLLPLLLAGCSQAVETPVDENPKNVVQAAIDTMNDDDIDKYLGLLTDDFVFTQDPPGTKIEGKKNYESSLKEQDDWNADFSITGPYDVDGNTVTLTINKKSDDLRILGMDSMDIVFSFHIRDGKIASIAATPDSEDWNNVLEMSRGTIGIQILTTEDGLLVEEVVENSPAFEAGIRPGDIIMSVDGLGYAQMRKDEPLLRLRGKVGTQVRLTVKYGDPPEIFDVVIPRVDLSQASSSQEPETGTPAVPNKEEPVNPPTETPLQSDELDVLDDILGIHFLAEGYEARRVLPAALGLCAQLALLPNGDVALASYNQNVYLLSGSAVYSLVASRDVMACVAALPDGRICYCQYDRIITIDPDSGTSEIRGTIPTGEGATALAVDAAGNIYAATHNKNLYRFDCDGSRAEQIARLPFQDSPSDIAIADNGDIYIIGPKLFVVVNPDGQITTLADNLLNEPAWCEIAPDGRLYTKDIFFGLRLFDTSTGTFSPVAMNIQPGTGDFLMPSADEVLLLPHGSDLIVSYSLTEGTAVPIAINPINSEAVAADHDGAVYFTTPSLPGTIKSYFLRVYPDGTTQALTEHTFNQIWSADVDPENRLCFNADDKFYRFEEDGSLTAITPVFPNGNAIGGLTKMAAGPDGLWYCISYDFTLIQLWTMDDEGNVTLLPVSFDLAFFDNAFQLSDSRIDVGNDGRPVFIVSAIGSEGQGPCYQRVYRCEADGSNLTLLGTFDSSRVAGMFDIAVGPANEILVFTCQKENGRFYEMIYRIEADGTIDEFLEIDAGRDPKGMDTDTNGNLWLCTTVGLFYFSH